MNQTNRKVACHTGSIFLLTVTILFSAPLLANKPSGKHNWQQGTELKPIGDSSLHSGETHPFRPVLLADKGADKQNKKWKDKRSNDKDHKRRFDALSPEEQQKIRDRRQFFKSLPPEERKRIERAREKFHDLPPERREEIKERWRKMTPEQRKEYHRRMENSDRYRKHQ